MALLANRAVRAHCDDAYIEKYTEKRSLCGALKHLNTLPRVTIANAYGQPPVVALNESNKPQRGGIN